MSKEVLDAVKTAKSIHDGDYSSLCDKSFVVCDNKKKKRRGSHVKKSKKNKYTLNQVVEMMNDNFKKIDAKMEDGFKQVNSRIDKIEDRLDYIVKANDLKDSYK